MTGRIDIGPHEKVAMNDSVAGEELVLPMVSVVIPVFNDDESVASCVRSVLAQDYPQSRFEVITVDNGSTDGSEAALHRFGSRILNLREARRGAAAARNLGIRHARGNYIAFTDADCEAAPHWLSALIETASMNPDAHFVGGPVRSLGATNAIGIYAERLFDHREALLKQKFPYAITGNVLVRKDFMSTIGLFDTQLLRGHDVELSYRALFEYEARFAYAPNAVIYHRNPTSLRALFAEGVKHGRGSANILARHADMIGVTPFGRALEVRRYRKICRCFSRWLRLLLNSDEAAKLERSDRLYDAVFNAGKQIGTLMQASRNALFLRPAVKGAHLDRCRDAAS